MHKNAQVIFFIPQLVDAHLASRNNALKHGN